MQLAMCFISATVYVLIYKFSLFDPQQYASSFAFPFRRFLDFLVLNTRRTDPSTHQAGWRVGGFRHGWSLPTVQDIIQYRLSRSKLETFQP